MHPNIKGRVVVTIPTKLERGPRGASERWQQPRAVAAFLRAHCQMLMLLYWRTTGSRGESNYLHQPGRKTKKPTCL